MKKIVIVGTLLLGLIGVASTVQAEHTDWVKTFWGEQNRRTP